MDEELKQELIPMRKQLIIGHAVLDAAVLLIAVLVKRFSFVFLISLILGSAFSFVIYLWQEKNAIDITDSFSPQQGSRRARSGYVLQMLTRAVVLVIGAYFGLPVFFGLAIPQLYLRWIFTYIYTFGKEERL